MLRESVFLLKLPEICFVRRKCATARARSFLSVLVWRESEVRMNPLACLSSALWKRNFKLRIPQEVENKLHVLQ